MYNMKEFNYCLRHHTHATMRMFNLVDVTPKLQHYVYEYISGVKTDRLIKAPCYSCIEGYAGTCPCTTEIKLELPSWINMVYLKEY